MASVRDHLERVQEYYGKVLGGSTDLKTNACCSLEEVPRHVRDVLPQIEGEVLDRFFGCGAPIPPALEGCTVLDLGCGSGRDAYIASRLVGEGGRVIGVDMTPEQLAVAERNLPAQMQRYEFIRSNVEFRQGYIENLAAIGIESESIDVVISDCVINLSPEKERVFAEILRVLRPGGELYFSDVFADRRLPARLMDDPMLHGECLAGALYEEDFRHMLYRLGCSDIRYVNRAPIAIEHEEIERRIGMARFSSMTIRAFKLSELEDRCEDYGQCATYLGTVEHYPHRFKLDLDHEFETGRPVRVCGNTAAMLSETRFGRHFRVSGTRDTHFGRFDCEANESPDADGSSPCC